MSFNKSLLKQSSLVDIVCVCLCVAAGACQNAAGVIPGGPPVPGSALFAHGDHQDIWKGGAQRRAPL